jgi:hypothetical protein
MFAYKHLITDVFTFSSLFIGMSLAIEEARMSYPAALSVPFSRMSLAIGRSRHAI